MAATNAYGFTPTQERQLRWLDGQEGRESLSWTEDYWVDCRDCGKDATFHCADSVRRFINEHRGHRTWIQYGGKRNPLAPVGGA